MAVVASPVAVVGIVALGTLTAGVAVGDREVMSGHFDTGPCAGVVTLRALPTPVTGRRVVAV